MSTGLVVIILILAAAFGGWVWWKLFNTSDGERYLKMRAQGPFAPISDETTAAQRNDPADH